MLTIIPIPALSDNYIWLIKSRSSNATLIVDPGEAKPVFDAIEQYRLNPVAVLNTHQHYDHINGIKPIVERYQIPVFGSSQELIPCLTHDLKHAHHVQPHPAFPEFKVLHIPGHTAGHIAYRYKHYLFSGDTIFSGGCGRLLGGTAKQLYQSIQQLCQLPKDTLIFASHEYTQQNLIFARQVEPANQQLQQYQQAIAQTLKRATPTLPTTLETELAINPFLRCQKSTIVQAVSDYVGYQLTTAEDVFAALRIWKDRT
jgi:hydroxyacylglutathione hydrolase